MSAPRHRARILASHTVEVPPYRSFRRPWEYLFRVVSLELSQTTVSAAVGEEEERIIVKCAGKSRRELRVPSPQTKSRRYTIHHVRASGVHSRGKMSKVTDKSRQVLPTAPSEQVTQRGWEARHARHAPPTTTTFSASMSGAALLSAIVDSPLTPFGH